MKFRLALVVMVLVAMAALAIFDSPASQAGREALPTAEPSNCEGVSCYSQGDAVDTLFQFHLNGEERAALFGLFSDPVAPGPSITWLRPH